VCSSDLAFIARLSRIRIWGFDCLNTIHRLKDYRDFHHQRNQWLISVIIKS
jgi:hypothetical protein